MRLSRISLLTLLFIPFLACDTKSDFEDDFKRYFIKYYGDDGDQEAVDFVVNNDGTVLLLGNTRPQDGKQKLLLIKVDPAGNALWTKQFGSGFDRDGNSIDENAQDIEPTVDGSGYLILSNLYRGVETSTNERLYDFKVIRIGLDGNKLDSMEFGNDLDPASTLRTWKTQFIRSITPLTSGGFAVTGNTTNETLFTDVNLDLVVGPDQEDVFALGFDANFQNTWDTGPSSDGEHYGSGIKLFEGGTDFYFFKYSDMLTASEDTYESNFAMAAVTEVGIKLAGRFAGTTNRNEILATVCRDAFGNFYGLGTSVTGSAAFGQLYYVRASDGSSPSSSTLTEWGTITVPGNLQARAVASAQRHDGYLILANEEVTAGTVIRLIKLNLDSEVSWSTSFGSTNKDGNSGAQVAELADGTILLFGTIELETQKKMTLMRLNSNGEFLN